MSTNTAESASDVVAALDATDPNVDGDTDETTAAAGDAGDDTDTGQSADDADETVEGEDALGDPGKKAIARMKARLKKERETRQRLEAQLNEKTPEDDPERIRRDAETAALAKANKRIVSAEIKAAATGKLADPADALAFIDTDQFDVDEDGSIDEDDIAQAITDLLESKPHLAAQGGSKTPKADPSQGAGGGGTASTADQFANWIGPKL